MEELTGCLQEDHLNALSLALYVLDTLPNAETLDKERHRQHLLNEISTRLSDLDPERRETFVDIPMNLFSSSIISTLIEAHRFAGHEEFVAELQQIAKIRQHWK